MSTQKVKFKRGTKAALESQLTVAKNNVPEAGEPIFEMLDDPSQSVYGRLKIGDGVHSYANLPYIDGDGSGSGGSGGSTTDSRFSITNPTINQVLLYDATKQLWVNKDLTDENSIIYLDGTGLTLQGYDDATNGQMLVKDEDNGLAWKTPPNLDLMNRYVDMANSSATDSANSALASANSASDAATAASNANAINTTTMEYVNNKFWWGTVEEYNALEAIDSGTFYFIKDPS